MKKKVFFKDEYGYVLLYEINRDSNNLYINCLYSNTGKHFTYHGSGVSGHKFKNEKNTTRHTISSRPPINEYIGTETILNLNVILDFGETLEIREQDMVVEISPPFSVEVIISSEDIDLQPLAGRETISVAKFLEISPFVFFEFYRPISGIPRLARYEKIYD